MLNQKMISVVMTTYNGEKYVVEQLTSIYHQTIKPDEVIICDDGSTDRTVELITAFISTNKLDNWSLIVNKPNIGWKANFFKVVGLSKGDIVFFSDQDDIWYDNKIEIMSDLMFEHNMGALFANRVIIDSEGNLMSNRQEKSSFSGKLSQIELKPSFYELKTLGCCMCISKKIAGIYQKVAFYEDDHDSQCGRLALLSSSLWYLDLPVIYYRIHETNSSGISGMASYGQSTREVRVESIKFYIKWINRVVETLELDTNIVSMLNGCESFLKKRLGYFEGSTSFLYLLTNYKYYTGLIMLIGDFFYKFGINKKVGRLFWNIMK